MVAVKVFNVEQQTRSEKALFKEARVGQPLDHPRLVRVFDAARIDGLAMLWMELVEGVTLFQRLGSEESPLPLDLDETLVWMEQIAEALAYLHSRSVAHGDLKLDNVLLDATAGVRLTDFGQSRTVEDCFVDTDGTGAWPYLAPEVMGKTVSGRGRRYLSSDIYAWGVIFYRLLTGRFPRSGLSEVVNLVPFPRLRELNPRIPAQLEEIVQRCLEKRPENRYQTGAELLAAIQMLRAAEPVEKPVDVTPAPLPRTRAAGRRAGCGTRSPTASSRPHRGGSERARASDSTHVDGARVAVSLR